MEDEILKNVGTVLGIVLLIAAIISLAIVGVAIVILSYKFLLFALAW